MAKVVAPSSLLHRSHLIGSGPRNSDTMMKRKTPSELRGEQLKRASAATVDLTDESPLPLSSTSNDVDNGLKRPGLSRNPKFIDTRVDDVFPAKKSRFRMTSGKENAKENTSTEKTSTLKNPYILTNLAATKQQGISCLENTVASSEANKDSTLQSCHTIEKCSQGKFLTVTELSSSADRSSGWAAIDMGNALRGLAAPELNVSCGLAANSSKRLGDTASTTVGNFINECHVPGHKSPLDLTLKTSMRIVSSSVNWTQRSFMRRTMPQFTFKHGTFKGQNMGGHSPNSDAFEVLHSWMYPQSTLPLSVISVLSSSTADGELEFLNKRQIDWEESFRNLYYMLRNNTCGIFYVCTSQFVAMFTGSDGSDKTATDKSTSSCNAYISQSTRGLRSLLREHDVCFSMPLCHSKVEQIATEDLVELSEIEKHNLGQTRRMRSFSDVDNTPQSLLVFSGNINVHGLYDLLLNYRSFFTSLSGMDVPVLCSPVPFQNAAVSSPDIKCMEMRRAEQIAASYDESYRKDAEVAQGSPDGLCCSIEIKNTILPPWIISGICSLMSSEGRKFEASFVTEPSSIGLNVAFNSTFEKSESKAASDGSLQSCNGTFGIPGAIVISGMRSCSLKGLKYSDDSYIASLSPYDHISFRSNSGFHHIAD
ncbi:uncharacterized protein LOC114740738 isoform X2 [Neltuma alba]|uniref:uncharacterized protein LOC114740738 isoform X2 n=1 Tax=Neltuma alba TaxID=207710 RepID=UPI0010A4B03E|nr:uncharacterized protein LOC114740738 isoform X2 [Prosopis alba]